MVLNCAGQTSAVVLVGDGLGVAVLAGFAVGVVAPVLLLPPDGAQAVSKRSSAMSIVARAG